MIGAVAGFGPSTLIAPVGVLVRIVPVMARMLPVGCGRDLCVRNREWGRQAVMNRSRSLNATRVALRAAESLSR